METYTLKLQDREEDKIYNFVEITLTPMTVFKNTLESVHNSVSYGKLKLPDKYLSLLTEALIKYNKLEYLNEFISFIPVVQESYIDQSILLDWSREAPFLKDLINENNDLVELLPIMKSYFENREELTRISFKVGKQTIPISNRNIILEICKGIASTYGFTEEDFKMHGITGKQQELMEKQHSQRINKVHSFHYLQSIKSSIVRAIIKLLFLKDDSNDNMRFAGLFLNICQLRSNNNIDVDIKDTLEENLMIQDVNNIRNYHTRDFK